MMDKQLITYHCLTVSDLLNDNIVLLKQLTLFMNVAVFVGWYVLIQTLCSTPPVHCVYGSFSFSVTWLSSNYFCCIISKVFFVFFTVALTRDACKNLYWVSIFCLDSWNVVLWLVSTKTAVPHSDYHLWLLLLI